MHRLAHRLTGEIPQRDITCGDRLLRHPIEPKPECAEAHSLPQHLDVERIFADQISL
jgi:hypothetical protein